MGEHWFADAGVKSRSFYVVRRAANPKHVYDREFYVTPGKTWPRRFRTRELAEAFAAKLNIGIAKATADGKRGEA